jgi:exodeoxyribonuclease-3
MDRFLGRHGSVDTYRRHNDAPAQNTRWSYRPGVRARNIASRLDYFTANPELVDRIARVRHQTNVHGSDHCPVELALRS